jgi:heme-degrading monooxygenase HmoA
MISRQWRGVAKSSDADRYVFHLKTETFPKLSHIEGFMGASILRRTVADGVEFRIVTTWDSMEAIKRFAGERPETAVVPEQVQAIMVSYDRTVDHYEVVE